MKNYWKLFFSLFIALLLFSPMVYSEDVQKNSTIIQATKRKLADGNYTMDVVIFEVQTTELNTYINTKKSAEDIFSNSYNPTDVNNRESTIFNLVTKLNSRQFETSIKLLDTKFKIQKLDTTGTAVDLPSGACKNVQTNQIFDSSQISDVSGNPLQGNTFGTCRIPRSEYQGLCNYFIAVHTPDPGSTYRVAPPSVPVEICDSETTSVPNSIRTTFVNLANPTPERKPLYIAAFALLGLLLASMYFSGKNPLSLLDIATPKIPSPKGLAAGGQILGPFGYTEMKRATGDMTSAASGAITKVFFPFAGSYTDKSALERIVGREVRKGKYKGGIVEEELPKSFTAADLLVSGELEKSKNFAKGIGIAALSLNHPDFTLDRIRGLLTKHAYRWEKGEHEMFAKLINELNKKPGSQKSMGTILTNYYLAVEQFKRLEALTGQPDIGKRSKWVQMVQTAIGATIGSKRFVHLSSYPHSAVDSMIRSGPVVGRFTGALVGSVIGGTADALNKIAGTNLQPLKHLPKVFAAGSPDQIVLGYLFPLHDKMKHQYEQLRDAAYRDIMRYTISQVLKKKGVRFDLTDKELAEHGYKYGFKSLFHRMGIPYYDESTEEGRLAAQGDPRLAAIRKFEHELHEILATDTYNIAAKTRAILDLAKENGVELHNSVDAEFKHLMDHHDPAHAGDEQVRLIDLYMHFQQHDLKFQNDKNNEYKDEFRYSIVRGNLLAAHEAWEVYNINRMIWEMENGYMHEGAGIKEIVGMSAYGLRNRVTSLIPTDQVYSNGSFGGMPPEKNTNAAVRLFDKHGNLLSDERLKNQSLPEFMLRGLAEGYGEKQAELWAFIKGNLTKEGLAAFTHVRDLEEKRKIRDSEPKSKLDPRMSIAEYDAHISSAATPTERLNRINSAIKAAMSLAQGYHTIHEEMHGHGYNIEGVSPKGKQKALFYLEDEAEVPTRKEWWKTDMTRLHVGGLDSREAYALGQYVQYRMTRANVAFHDPGIESKVVLNEALEASIADKIGKRIDPKKWTEDERKYWDGKTPQIQKLYLEKLLVKDMHEFMNSLVGYGLYEGGQDQMRFHVKAAAAFLARVLDQKGEYDEAIKNQLENLDITSAKQMNEFRELYHDHFHEVEAYLKNPLKYNDVAKSTNPWIQTYEGGFIPYLHGMPIAAFDRMLGGYAAIKNDKGHWQRIDFTDIGDAEIHAALGSELTAQYKKLRGQGQVPNSHAEWKEFMKDAREETKKHGFDGEKAFTGLVKNYADITGDLQSFWNLSEMRIVPKREAAPLAPASMRFFGVDPEFFKTPPVKAVRNAFFGVGDWVSRMFFAAGAHVHEASWEITGSSEIFKQQGWHMAHDILSGRMDDLLDGISTDKNNKSRKTAETALRDLALSYGAYRGVWLWAIDRNPWEMFKEEGSMQRLSSGFHTGPRKTYPVELNMRPNMSAQEYTNFKLMGGFMMDDFHLPFLKRIPKIGGVVDRLFTIPGITTMLDVYSAVFRTAQEELQGSPYRMDFREHYTKPHQFTNPRLGNFAYALLNPFSVYQFSGPIMGNIQKGVEYVEEKLGFGTQMKARFGAGRELGLGIRHTPQEASFLRPGLFAYYRTGPVNPGTSILTMRYTHEFDPLQAQMLAYRSMVGRGGNADLRANPSRAFFKEYIPTAEAGMRDTIRRKVDPIYWQYHGEETRRTFGWFANQANVFASPVHYIWSSGFGLIPLLSQLSPKEFFNQGGAIAKRAKETYSHTGSYKEARQVVTSSVKATVLSGGGGLKKAVQVRELAKTVTCPVCNSSTVRGSYCASCRSNSKNTFVP